MLRISEVVRGANVDLNQRLTGCFCASPWVRGFCAVVGMVLPYSHGDLGLSLHILLQRGSPVMERLDFPDERASLWMYIHFAGHHHYAAEHRH